VKQLLLTYEPGQFLQQNKSLRTRKPGFDSRQENESSFRYHLHIGSGGTELPIQWVPRVLSPGIKWPKREADYFNLLPRCWSYTSAPPYTFMMLKLIKHLLTFIRCTARTHTHEYVCVCVCARARSITSDLSNYWFQINGKV
jgi:hypothetical protein